MGTFSGASPCSDGVAPSAGLCDNSVWEPLQRIPLCLEGVVLIAGLCANSAWAPSSRVPLCSDGIVPVAGLCVDSVRGLLGRLCVDSGPINDKAELTVFQ